MLGQWVPNSPSRHVSHRQIRGDYEVEMSRNVTFGAWRALPEPVTKLDSIAALGVIGGEPEDFFTSDLIEFLGIEPVDMEVGHHNMTGIFMAGCKVMTSAAGIATGKGTYLATVIIGGKLCLHVKHRAGRLEKF